MALDPETQPDMRAAEIIAQLAHEIESTGIGQEFAVTIVFKNRETGYVTSGSSDEDVKDTLINSLFSLTP